MAKVNKDRDSKIFDLKRENKFLKRKLDNISSYEDNCLEITNKIPLAPFKEKNKRCVHCSGEIKKVEVFNYLFEICQNCKNRVKLKKEEG